jgi:hypothetical protein
MSSDPCIVTIVNHVAAEILCDASVLWEDILNEYLRGAKFREHGFTIEPAHDPASPLGSYWMRLRSGDSVVDERLCKVTELDPTARRLSLFADFQPGRPGGVRIHATYQVLPISRGARYSIDSHTETPLHVSGDANFEEAISELQTAFEESLVIYLSRVKSRLDLPD